MERYDLILLLEKINFYSFKIIVLQFPDDELPYSIFVYEYLDNHLNTKLNENESEIELYITADSTWGSSVDDISALHCNCDVLIYFGTDLSSSGTIPVMIVPPIKKFNIEHCCELIQTSIQFDKSNSLILFYEPSYYQSCQSLMEYISSKTELNIILSKLPLYADLQNWIPHVMNKNTINNIEATDSNDNEIIISIGGLLITKSYIENSHSIIIYIGDKSEQIVNIMLRLTQFNIFHYSPIKKDICTLHGSNSREFKERYGGVLKVKDAKIIGILIGSMGLTAELTNDILYRLQQLILAANKRYYSFVMGRLNEAKLCNFPEIDVFCFISNEDNANIKPKTFHKPVITPYELELGLGSQDWDSIFTTDLNYLLGNGEEDLKNAIVKVKEEYFKNNPTNDDDNINNEIYKLDYINIKENNQLIKANSNELTVFYSPSAEYYKDKEYHGLNYSIEINPDMNIHNGLYGIASSYTTLNQNINNNNNIVNNNIVNYNNEDNITNKR